MKFCVTCVYWMLLLISVVSSGLLFFIVACESVSQAKHTLPSEKSEKPVTYDNVTTVDKINIEDVVHIDTVIVETQNLVKVKATRRSYSSKEEEPTVVSASAETLTSEEITRKGKDLEILAETLTQQPNLSQGISETGQAVVLTLVDTAAAELQSLAEPHINSDQFRPRPAPGLKNLSTPVASTTVSRHQQEKRIQQDTATQTTQIPAPPILDETTERPNVTDGSGDGGDQFVLPHHKPLLDDQEVAPEVVVVVRAEQKIATETTGDLQSEEDVVGGQATLTNQQDSPKVEDGLSAAPELNDSAARARLVGGDREDATSAVILDGLVASGPTDPHEDIPSFSEWAQKRLEEAEKKKTHPNASVQNPGAPGRSVGGMKVRSKNYASPDCGAKIVAVNPEARSAKSVLVSTRDEYMLNTCTSRIWFVVELCEAIQAKKIELANFELFSSSPKEFSVFVSDRFPTRDWSPVGQFTAKDEKDIQSFTLHPHLFGKFIKVEVHSYHGSEHFCPISLFRAYGTSEFEVLETETENQVTREISADADDEEEDSDEEELIIDAESDGEPPRNLFGSARDAVLSIVKKAAEVLVKSSDLSGNNITNIQRSIDSGGILENSYNSCTTPRYTILCGNCSDQKFAKVFQLVSCRDQQLEELLRNDVINRTLRHSDLCGIQGVDIRESWKDDEEDDEERNGETVVNLQATFLASLFKSDYIVALCNVLATKERKVVMNTSYEIPSNGSENVTGKEDIVATRTADQTVEMLANHRQSTTDYNMDSSNSACKTVSNREHHRRSQELPGEENAVPSATTIDALASKENLALQIKPTKTLNKEDLKKDFTGLNVEPSKELKAEGFQTEVITTIPPTTSVPTPTLKIDEEPIVVRATTESIPRAGNVPTMTSDTQEALENTGTEEYFDPSLQNKIDKLDQIEQEVKQGKLDIGEQEAKISSQDHLTFDLLSDLKDFEGDTVNLQNGHANSATTMQPTASTTPQQKESVFLRLSNRIKALERNMSLSGQYLEELSRRYKKQVEEMQRSLERAISAMGEESRKGEERETKKVEEIAALREEIAILSKSVESLLYDRDSWRGRISAIGQYALLISLQVVIVILILSYCRRNVEFEDEEEEQTTVRKGTVRRKSSENFSGNSNKKTKKRRPSEIASHIVGSYRELMIDDRCQDTKKERKKKRKRDTNSGGSGGLSVSLKNEAKREIARYKSVLNVPTEPMNVPSRRASSIEPPTCDDLQTQIILTSASDSTVGFYEGYVERIELCSPGQRETESERQLDLSTQADELSETNSSSTNVDRSSSLAASERRVETSKNGSSKASGILKSARLSSPSFMKTALVSRRKRKLSSNRDQLNFEACSANSSDLTRQESPTSLKSFSGVGQGTNGGTTTNGLLDESDGSRSGSATPNSGKKEKKSTGLKKMVRKLF